MADAEFSDEAIQAAQARITADKDTEAARAKIAQVLLTFEHYILCVVRAVQTGNQADMNELGKARGDTIDLVLQIMQDEV